MWDLVLTQRSELFGETVRSEKMEVMVAFSFSLGL